jgi:hypothetical protein
MHFDPYLISKERNEGPRREVSAVQLKKRLRENRGRQASRFTTLVRRTRCCIAQSLQCSPSPCVGR